MATGLLPIIEVQETDPEQQSIAAGEAAPPIPVGLEPAQPAYLTRLSTLPDRADAASNRETAKTSHRPESTRLDQIEHALTILASVVARLAKDAQQSRLQLRATEHDPSLQEERRVQRELVRSMQARLNHIEERLSRETAARGISAAEPSPVGSEAAEQLALSLTSIRDSLASIAKRRKQPSASSD